MLALKDNSLTDKVKLYNTHAFLANGNFEFKSASIIAAPGS